MPLDFIVQHAAKIGRSGSVSSNQILSGYSQKWLIWLNSLNTAFIAFVGFVQFAKHFGPFAVVLFNLRAVWWLFIKQWKFILNDPTLQNHLYIPWASLAFNKSREIKIFALTGP